MHRLRQQAGDTIVEVLIAMAVLSFVLGAAYATTSRTLNNSRQSQERGEALQRANKQVELLSRFSAKASAADYAAAMDGSVRCINDELQVIYSTCQDSFYTTSFKYVMSDPKHFEVLVYWESITGNGNDRVTVSYRPYRP